MAIYQVGPTLPNALPWLSWYDPYWWRHDDVVDVCQPMPVAAPSPCSRPGPVSDTYCCANPLIGQTVLARRVEDGYYHLGHVKQEISRDRFLVLFDGATRGRARSSNLQEVWLFDIISFADAFRHQIVAGDRVLVHIGESRYSPASVLQGSEQRSGNCCVRNTDLLVNYFDGTTERIPQGVAIWIPPSLYDRLVFELKLPFEARRTLQRQPETVIGCDVADGSCFDDCSGWPACGEECPHIVTGNPYQCSSYYRTLFKTWPWWWRWWYQQAPPPWANARTVYQQCPANVPVPSPPRQGLRPLGMRRSRSASNMLRGAPTTIVCDEDFGECYEVPVVNDDPLSRKVADQITEHSRIVLSRRNVSPCRIHYENPDNCYPTKEEIATQTPVRTVVRQWRPPTRWMPTNKNQYGANKPLNVNYVQQDRAVSEWEHRSKPRPMTSYVPPQLRQAYHCRCSYC